ncbi:7431_t:CDS:2 [Entrophospora sp. SA101]|nr:7431_t:CDS:2 [Entrophospora sp. SA101]
MSGNPMGLVQGTVAVLKAKGALITLKTNRGLSVFNSGDVNYKTWSDYGKKIYKYLTSINDDVRLESEQSDTIYLEAHDKHSYYGDTIVWTCQGSITVTDIRTSSSGYETKFKGRSVMKILIVDSNKMKMLEQTAGSDMQNAKRKVDSETKRLTWG